MNLIDKEKCTGCSACVNTCPKSCIQMIKNKQGFLYPEINNKLCINCGACIRVCPEQSDSFSPFDKRFAEVQIATNEKDPECIKLSSSGGVVHGIAKGMLKDNGIVYGVCYDDDMKVKHTRVDVDSELTKIQGSKYVQSELADSFSQIREDLFLGKRVLFIGTPCQVAGLYSYIGNKRKNLFTIDLFCGGCPSPTTFQKYIDSFSEQVSFVNFRNKKYGYGFGYLTSFTDRRGKEHVIRGKKASFVRLIGKGYIRESCFNCKYRCLNRIGDLTVGDPWDYNLSDYEQKFGASLIIENSIKGHDMIKLIEESWSLRTVKMDLIQNKAQIKKKPLDYDAFFEDQQIHDWKFLNRKYIFNKLGKSEFLEMIPPFLTSAIRKVIRKYKQYGNQ